MVASTANNPLFALSTGGQFSAILFLKVAENHVFANFERQTFLFINPVIKYWDIGARRACTS